MSAPKYLEERPHHRRTVQRMSMLYGPLALVFGSLFILSSLNFLSGPRGAIIPMILFGILTAAVTHEAVTATLDLRTTPVTTTARVRRTWSRGGLLWWFRAYYVLAGNSVFEVLPLTSLTLQAGDTIEVEHWPHTRTVIRMRLVEQAAPRAYSTDRRSDPGAIRR